MESKQTKLAGSPTESRQSQENERLTKPHPFDFGIKRLKRELAAGGMSKSDINKTVKLYKGKLYKRIEEVKAKMDAVTPTTGESSLKDILEKGDEHASNK